MARLRVEHRDVPGRLRRRPRSERGEPARQGRHAAARVGLRAGRVARGPRHGRRRGQRLDRGRRGDAPEHRSDRDGPEHVRRSRRLGGRSWDGWWGDDPPFHTPVFVVTHHPREPLAMEGGTTFIFVTDGIESAHAQAREAAGGKDVSLGGGAAIVQQYLRAGLIDELQINLVPVLLGGGARLFDEPRRRRREARVHARGRGSGRDAPPLPRRLMQPSAAVVREVLGVLRAAAPATTPAPADRGERAHQDSSGDGHPRADAAAIRGTGRSPDATSCRPRCTGSRSG